MRIIKLLIPLIFLVILVGAPSFPESQVYKGTVKINGDDAPIGTKIEAYIQGDDDPEVADGSTTIGTEGIYLFTVNGCGDDKGKNIIFKINGVTADQTAEFLVGGDLVTLDLTVTISETTTTTTSTSTTTTIAGCVTGEKPPDCDGKVDDFELLAYINEWVAGLVSDFELLEAIDNWAKG